MASGNKEKVIGICIVVLVAIAVIVLFEDGAFRLAGNTSNKLPYSYVPSCATYNNCTSDPCPAGSYFNDSLNTCFLNYTCSSQNCGGVQPTLNNTNSTCTAGYKYYKGVCEPPTECKNGYAFYAKGTLSSTAVCALANACSNGYNLTFNQSINDFLCVR